MTPAARRRKLAAAERHLARALDLLDDVHDDNLAQHRLGEAGRAIVLAADAVAGARQKVVTAQLEEAGR